MIVLVVSVRSDDFGGGPLRNITVYVVNYDNIPEGCVAVIGGEGGGRVAYLA